MLDWIEHDLTLVPASRAITERPAWIQPAATAEEAVQALSDGATHLLVARAPGETPQGVVADLDVIALCARR